MQIGVVLGEVLDDINHAAIWLTNDDCCSQSWSCKLETCAAIAATASLVWVVVLENEASREVMRSVMSVGLGAGVVGVRDELYVDGGVVGHGFG